ncbi:allantoinase AllB [Cohnella hashimotonis]|uniref:Allantoinase n=1 Tax=Cohnella hashimotonis TaxID=2826895 RepID=A0ABT6TJY4_9BACL|nr:allantoinase AllB [Cohnella hashimotonis]MDI4646254.1 allantoinase AllB [Cohnella hashimotonis]
MGKDYDLIVKGGFVALPEEAAFLDIGIRGGKIAAIGAELSAGPGIEIVDARGKWVLPGVVDAHVHLNEPGMGHWEGFASGSAALAAGGCTTFVDMPLNGLPPTVNVEALAMKADRAAGVSSVDYAFWGGLVPGNVSDLQPLHESGVKAFKAFLSDPGGETEDRFREVDDLTLLEGMRTIASFDGLLGLHAESEAITSRLAEKAAADGRTDAADFIATRPVVAELEAVGRALLFARETGCRLHFVHMSSPEAVELIAQARREGLDVTAETCPHYLVLSDRDMERIGPAAKCAPPMRDDARRERLWQQIAEGSIDVIASDHSPSPEAWKSMEGRTFMSAWGGIAGAQSSLELMLDEGAVKRGLPLPVIAKLMADGPAKRFGLDDRKGRIAVGRDADLAIVDPGAAYTLRREDLYQRHRHSPYIGRTFSCRVVNTFVRGQLVYSLNGGGIVRAGGGELLSPLKERVNER